MAEDVFKVSAAKITKTPQQSEIMFIIARRDACLVSV